MRLDQSTRRTGEGDQARGEALEAIQEWLRHLRFGTIALTVHDGRITQLEVTEKRRFGH